VKHWVGFEANLLNRERFAGGAFAVRRYREKLDSNTLERRNTFGLLIQQRQPAGICIVARVRNDCLLLR